MRGVQLGGKGIYQEGRAGDNCGGNDTKGNFRSFDLMFVILTVTVLCRHGYLLTNTLIFEIINIYCNYI